MSKINGRIKVGKATSKHQETLEQLNYDVSVEDGHLIVPVTKVITSTQDCSTKELLKAALKSCVDDGACFNYSTKFIFAGKDRATATRTLFGIPACGVLGQMSCLVMKTGEPKAKASKEAGVSVEDLMD